MAVNVFVSYSFKDKLAATLVGTLRANREVRVFIAHQQQAAPGTSIREWVLRNGLQRCDVLLLLWSRRAAESEWVEEEVGLARQLGKPIVPLMLEEDAELPPALSDIQALRLDRNPEAGMSWLAMHLAHAATPWWQRALRTAVGNPRLGNLVAAGVAVGIGLLAAAADEKPAAADPPARPAPRRRPRRAVQGATRD